LELGLENCNKCSAFPMSNIQADGILYNVGCSRMSCQHAKVGLTKARWNELNRTKASLCECGGFVYPSDERCANCSEKVKI